MMRPFRSRVEELERKARFRHWLAEERFLEGLTAEQLLDIACHGHYPEPLPPPLPRGASRLDGMDRKSLMKLFEEEERLFGGRTGDELLFFAVHGHWAEQGCGTGELHGVRDQG